MDQRGKQTSRSIAWKRNRRSKNQTGNGGPVYISRFAVKGGSFKVPENPPDVTLQPWLPITILLDISSDWTLYVKDLVAAFRNQYDGEGKYLNPVKENSTDKTKAGKGLKVELRLISVKGWALEGKTLTAVIFDPLNRQQTQKNVGVLKIFFDSGTPSHIPSFGYKYPDAISERILISSDDTDAGIDILDEDGSSQLIKLDVAGSSHVMCYFSILIKPYGNPKMPSIKSLPSRLLSEACTTRKIVEDIGQSMSVSNTGKNISHLTNVADKMAEILAELKIISEAAERSKPSTLSKIVDGVKYTAMAVATIAGTEVEREIGESSEESVSGEWIQ